jgi:(2Fe-2S) ferredoxin/ferredoxin
MRLVVNEYLCDGYGKCERVAPDLFTLDEAGMAHLLIEGDLSTDQLMRAQAALNLCPVNAISITGSAADFVGESKERPNSAPAPMANVSDLTAPFERHVFVCTTGEYCPVLDGDGSEIHKAFKEQAAMAGLKGRVRVNKSGCLDQCGHGPNVVVYPEGVWYSHLTLDDVPEIVAQHLSGGRPVERCRYHPPRAGANKLQRNADQKLMAGQIDGCRADRPVVPLDNPDSAIPTLE